MNANDITPELLSRLAGSAAYQRGERYAQNGRVELGAERNGVVHATVEGSETYKVRLEWVQGGLAGSCDCPVGGSFCKHQVATALCWVSEGDDGNDNGVKRSGRGKRKQGGTATESDEDILRRWLGSRSADALHDLILDLAGRDRNTWRALVAQARFAFAAPQDMRKAVGQLIGRPRFLDYRASIDYSLRIAALSELLGEQLERDAVAALELADYALHRLFAVYERSDDSSGSIGDVLQRIGELHLQAAIRARPSASTFARAYYKLRQADDWSIVGGLDDYAEVLGRGGIGVLERLVLAAADKLPSKPAGRFARDEYMGERYTLEALQQELVHHGGDLDVVIANLAQQLGSAWDYQKLSNLCREHGRERQATDWLERGLKAHSKDRGLVDALAEARERDGLVEEALDLRWRAFRHEFDERAYLALRRVAEPLGAWPQWREKALALVDDRAEGHPGRDVSRVILHLAEGDIASAWGIAGKARLPLHIWAALAPRLEGSEPEGALRAYRTLVQGSVEKTNRQGYTEAIGWLERMWPLHRRLGTGAAFTTYLETLRQTWRAKRSFVEMLGKFAQRVD